MLDRCWRRSGKLLYRPNQRASCCPHYTIRLDSDQFYPTRGQRQTINRFNKYVLGETYAKQAARLYPRSREETKKRDNEFCLTERIHEAELNRVKTPPEPAHKWVVTLEEDTFTEEKYLVYDNYQRVVHGDEPGERTRHSFERFLCNSPVQRQVMVGPDGRKRRLGSYHQCYRLDGVLVAVGVLDLLPQCVSSVYFLYHESVHAFAPGKLGALYEIALAVEEGYRWWYPGFYIHSCPKMKYKIDYGPQYILDPDNLDWRPLDKTILDILGRDTYTSFSTVLGENVSNASEMRSAVSTDMSSGGASRTSMTLDESPQSPEEASSDEEVDEEVDEVYDSLFRSKMPGIPSVATMESLDLDHIILRIFPTGPLFETSDLVGWRHSNIRQASGIRHSIAQLIAALGPDLMGEPIQLFVKFKNLSATTITKPPFHAPLGAIATEYPASASQTHGNTVTMAQQTLLSPAELAYLHSSLSLSPPIRPDGRTAKQFRPLTAETGILPGTNGSARVCLADGTEAIVGVKAEIEKTVDPLGGEHYHEYVKSASGAGGGDADEDRREARGEWLEMTVEIPGLRDDDAGTMFLAELLREALLADGEFAKKLWINRRFHWRLYLDILLISPPLSYPLPLLSLTTHLALLATRLPRLKSEGDEDPMFDDDWEAAPFLYPREGAATGSRPSITLLVVAVGDSILFDPSKEELAVADSALAVSLCEVRTQREQGGMEVDSGRELRLVSMRTIDPPSRLTPPGVPSTANLAASGTFDTTQQKQQQRTEEHPQEGVWKAPLGGTRFAVLDSIMQAVLEKRGVADEVLDGLEGVDLA
ncbi:arginine-tRNA-protein transferase [Trichoderma pleuroticola]